MTQVTQTPALQRPAAAPRTAPSINAKTANMRLGVFAAMFPFLLIIHHDVQLILGSVQLPPFRIFALFYIITFSITHPFRLRGLDWVLLMLLTLPGFVYVGTGSMAEVVQAVGREGVDSAGIYLFGRSVAAKGPAFIARFLRYCGTVLVAMVPLIILEALFAVNVAALPWTALGADASGYGEQRLGFERAQAWTSHPIMLGLAYHFVLPVFLADLLCNQERRLGTLMKIGACLIAVFFTLSSGAWFPVILLCASIALFIAPRNYTPYIWSGLWIGGPILYVALEFLSGRPLLRVMMMKFHLSSPDAWYYRWRLYERVMEVMPGRWVTGWGLGLPEEFLGGGRSVDNHYLVLLLTKGYVGLICFLGVVVLLILRRYRSMWHTQVSITNPQAHPIVLDRLMILALVTTAMTLLTVALFSTAATLFVLFVGLVAGRLLQHRNRGIARPVPARRPAPAPAPAPTPRAPIRPGGQP